MTKLYRRNNMKNHSLLSVILVSISVILLGTSILVHHKSEKELTSHRIEYKAAQRELKEAKTNYTKYKGKLNREYQKGAVRSPNAKVRSVANNDINLHIANQKANQFFDIFYTFSNQKDYRNRSDKLLNKKLITAEYAKDKSTFDDGKDTEGGDYIGSLKLSSRFIQAAAFQSKTVRNQLLTVVTFESWFGDKEPATTNILYKVNYDGKNKQISHVEKVMVLHNSANLDNLE